MADVELSVEGLNSLIKDLRRAAEKDSLDEIKAANKEAATLVADAAKYEVPVRSGALRDSIRGTGSVKVGQVRAGKAKVPYAGPIHFGWPRRHIKPQPFIYDALDKRIGEVIDAYEQRVSNVVDAINNG